MSGIGAALLVVAMVAYYLNEGGLSKPTELTTQLQLKEPLARSLAAPAVSMVSSSVNVKNLAIRCQTAMIKDVCGVMTASAPRAGEPSTERLFIAGVGEVDAQAFNRLREAGDHMCAEVERECDANWLGAGCKIARAMYPL